MQARADPDSDCWFDADANGEVLAASAAAAQLGVLPGMPAVLAAARLSHVFDGLSIGETAASHAGQRCWRYGPAHQGADRTRVLRERLQQETCLRRLLERQLISSAEREQRRMSLELHDGLGQHLSGLAYTAASLATRLKQEDAAQADEAAWLARLLKDAVGRVRSIARGLWPVSLERQSLPQALEALAQDTEHLFGITVTVEAEGFVAESALVAHHLFRIVQESVHNALKHGRSRRITIRIEELPDVAMLTVTGDGLPLDGHALRASKGLGLLGMRLRAEALGGALSVEPLNGGGAEVCLTWRPRRARRAAPETHEEALLPTAALGTGS